MTSKQDDPVNHPSHYTSGAVECIDAIEAALGREGFIDFLRGQVIKYQWRLGKKDSPKQDAEKALWYSNKLVLTLSKHSITTTKGEALTDNKGNNHVTDSNSTTPAPPASEFFRGKTDTWSQDTRRGRVK